MGAGSGFWITSRRCVSSRLNEQRTRLLFKPQTALRVRWNINTDTPLPPDEPVGENPPDGAMIDYSLGKDRRAGHARNQGRERECRASLCQHRSGSSR